MKQYKFGVKINNKIKWLNSYDYLYNARVSRNKLMEIGFKKEEIIILTYEK